MAVMFTTQQGRTLRNDVLTVEDLWRNIGVYVAVVGHELGREDGPLFHVSPRHIVEWWEPR